MDDVTAWMNDAAGHGVRVGLAHGSVERRLPASAEITNPIDPDRAERARLDYLALGDWHGCREIAPRTWYAGTPEADGWRANESGRVLLVEIDGPGVAPRVRPHTVGRFTWHDRQLDLSHGAVEEALQTVMAELEPLDRSVLALRLSGALDLTGRETLESLLRQWSSRLHHLEWDDADLRVVPGDHDLLSFGVDPLVSAVAARLRARLTTADPADRDAAALALRLLWRQTLEAERCP